MYVRASFYPGGVFHVYNRGVAKQDLFHDNQDYQHFLDTLSYYLEQAPSLRFSRTTPEDRKKIFAVPVAEPLVRILAYCLMPNHFHLMLCEEVEGGVSTFMRRAMNSYTRGYNTRYKRVGTVFQGTFSAVTVQNNEQYLHLSRYEPFHFGSVSTEVKDLRSEVSIYRPSAILTRCLMYSSSLA